jgi:hypothetical protein
MAVTRRLARVDYTGDFHEAQIDALTRVAGRAMTGVAQLSALSEQLIKMAPASALNLGVVSDTATFAIAATIMNAQQALSRVR